MERGGRGGDTAMRLLKNGFILKSVRSAQIVGGADFKEDLRRGRVEKGMRRAGECGTLRSHEGQFKREWYGNTVQGGFMPLLSLSL